METEEDIQISEDYTLDDVLVEEPAHVDVVINRKDRRYWLRPPTRTERAMAQNAARRKAIDLRDRLENPNSEEHDLLIVGQLENMPVEEKRLMWLTSNLYQKTFELNRISLDNRDEYFTPEPEGKMDGLIPPAMEEWEQYEKDRREAEKNRLKDLQTSQKAIFAQLKKEAEELDEENLDTIIEIILIEQLASEEWSNQYGMQILVRCTFMDSEFTEKAFKTQAQAERLLHTKNGNKVLESLLAAHSGLMLDPDQLKN